VRIDTEKDRDRKGGLGKGRKGKSVKYWRQEDLPAKFL